MPTKSIWMQTPVKSFPSLASDEKADICIVGAGIAGLTCAYTLAKAGKMVVVVDKSELASGQTERTTAHLTWALDERYQNLESLFGESGSKIAKESHEAAINYIEKIVREEKIDCDFTRVDGYLFLDPKHKRKLLEDEIESLKKTGVSLNIVNSPNGFPIGDALHFPHQAQFHILKYLAGLTDSLLRMGVRIYTKTIVKKAEKGVVITQEGHRITASSIFFATGTPINDRFMIHTKQAPYRTYVLGALIPKGSVPKALYWDTADPYHYIRIQNHVFDDNFEWIIVGGEDHKTGQESNPQLHYNKLEKWARNLIPQIKEIEFKWSGQVFDSIDSLGFIGKNPYDENVYIATGDSGNGMTHGTIAGMLIPDLILNKSNPWKELYDPSRKTLSAAPEFIKEGANVAWQYRDWFTDIYGQDSLEQVEKLRHEEGIVLRKGLKKIAVFKDEAGQLHVKSAVCPHLGACVRWNKSEKTWDCPCHGSQFSGKGCIINGPAVSQLADEEDIT